MAIDSQSNVISITLFGTVIKRICKFAVLNASSFTLVITVELVSDITNLTDPGSIAGVFERHPAAHASSALSSSIVIHRPP